MMMRSLVASAVLTAVAACKNDPPPVPIFDAGPPPATTASAPVDLSQCPGCQLTPQTAWSFEGVYRDAACTEPLAQALVPACAAVPTLGQVSLTYSEEAGTRKAGEAADVKLLEVVAPETARYRKTAKGCVAANETATDVTPACAAGGKVCRTTAGSLACDGCRTLTGGCPDYEETRLYATVEDSGAKASGGGGGGIAVLAQCCRALAAEGKRLGASPEGATLLQAAAQCQLIAANGAGGVEFAAIKSMLAGRKLPALCAGL